MHPGLNDALLALRKYSRVLRHRRASADCFGANSVASALGNRTGRDPGTAVRTYHEGFLPALKTGTFYLAGNRNFLFGSDIRWELCHQFGRGQWGYIRRYEVDERMKNVYLGRRTYE